MKQDVIFLIEKDSENDVFAYFPQQKECYAHIGQHSKCSEEYAMECKKAKHYQYYELLIELVSQVGYRNLNVLNGELIKCWRNPTKGEIKFGEGAIHYRDFTISEIGINNKGYIKSWFIDKEGDGLRYNHY